MDIKTQINQAAMGCFAEAMRLSAARKERDANEHFKVLMTVTVKGEAKLLLLFGKLYPYYGDGYCYGVLNPSATVLECVDASLAYDKSALNRPGFPRQSRAG